METREIPSQESTQEIKYQNIIYFKNNRHEYVSGLEFLAIDFLKAMYERNTLDYTFSENFVRFSKKWSDAVLLRRRSKTEGSVEIPTFEGEKRTGFGWFAHDNTKTISNMLQLFFEKVSWSGMLSWKMGRRDHE